MEEQLTKKYGLPTAIAMVIGIVIGSGIFFKAEKILTATGGDLKTGILAWLLGGCIAIASACAFAVMATRYEKVGRRCTSPASPAPCAGCPPGTPASCWAMTF